MSWEGRLSSKWDHEFESGFLQERVRCELDFLVEIAREDRRPVGAWQTVSLAGILFNAIFSAIEIIWDRQFGLSDRPRGSASPDLFGKSAALQASNGPSCRRHANA